MKAGVSELLGPACGAYAGYAADADVRDGASSGGFATSFLIYLLENGLVDGALVSRTYIENGRLNARSFIARTRDELLDARTSIYMMFPYTRGLEPLLKEPMKVAAVALPCQLDMMGQWESEHPGAKGKVVWRVGLFCSKGTSASLVHAFMERHNIRPEEVKRFFFRRGQWKGAIVWEDIDGGMHSLPYINFAFYNNLYIHQPALCLGCGDGTAMNADISCGDAWLPHLKRHAFGHSLIITRTQSADGLFKEFCNSGAFQAEALDVRKVLQAQRRTLIKKHYFSIASQRLGPLFGYKIKARGGLPPRWNHYLGSALVMFSMRVGRSRRLSRLLLRLPRWTLYPYMALLKAMMSF